MINFRIAGEADVEALASMRWDVWREGGNDPPVVGRDEFIRFCSTTLREDMRQCRLTIWVAVDGQEIMGHFYIYRIEKVPKPSKLQDAFGYVTNAYTKPQYRNRGIGSELFTHVKTWAAKEDIEFMVLWPSNASIRFWQRAGFVPGEAIEFGVRPYIN